jgi:serine/threonine protein kinase
MGVVYLGFTPGGRPVAVKVVRPELGDDPEFRARFRQEVAAARRVHGLYTAQVVDADPQASPPWLATTYVAGPSLTQAVKRARAVASTQRAAANRGGGRGAVGDTRGRSGAPGPEAVERAAGR